MRTQRGILHRGRGVDTEDHGVKIEWQDELESLCSGEDAEGDLHRGRGVDTEDHGAKIEWQDELESLCSGEDTEGIITLTQKFSEKENFREKCATSVFP